MDPQLSLQLDRNPLAFQPGELLKGAASWKYADRVKSAMVRLYWTTSGRGTTDTTVVAETIFANPLETDQRTFEFSLPDLPPSFSGKLISLGWGIELIISPGEFARNVEIVVGPDAREILLPVVTEEITKKSWFMPRQ